MSELDTQTRINQIKSTLEILEARINNIPTFIEIDKVISEIEELLRGLENRIMTLEHNSDMIETVISTTTG